MGVCGRPGGLPGVGLAVAESRAVALSTSLFDPRVAGSAPAVTFGVDLGVVAAGDPGPLRFDVPKVDGDCQIGRGQVGPLVFESQPPVKLLANLRTSGY